MIFFQNFIDFLFCIYYDVLIKRRQIRRCSIAVSARGGKEMSIRYDFHLHSDFSADSDVPARQMVERAICLGLCGICFTEHHDPDFPSDTLSFTLDPDSYFPALSALRKEYEKKLWIGIGMEFGIQPHLAPVLLQLAKQYPFDFIIASRHLLYGQDPYNRLCFKEKREDDCYADFFREQYTALKQLPPDSYDTLGHLDYVVRYGPNQNLFYSYEKFADVIDPILHHLIDNGKCLEVNTGGLKYGLGEPNPCIGILRRYRDLGGELITLGSDAHTPQHLCFDFAKVQDILTFLGFRHYTVFRQRRPEQILL